MFKVKALASIATVMLSLHIHAADDKPMTFSTYSPCAGSASFCGNRILAQGVIQPDSGLKFTQFLKNRRAHKNELPPRPTVVFDSPGGSILGAMDLGRAIRANRMDTELDTSYSKLKDGSISEGEKLVQSATCASACALAFSGGLTRVIHPNSRLGVHQFSVSRGAIGDGRTQVTVVVLAAYLEEMGVRRGLLDLASLIPPSEIRWLTASEAKLHRLDNTEPELMAWNVKATEDGIPTLEVIQTVSQGRTVFIRLMPIGDFIGLSITTALERATFREDRLAQFPIREKSRVTICGDKLCIDAQPVTPWSRKEGQNAVIFQTVVAIRRSELQLLAAAKILSISDGFGNATSDISMSTNLSSSGFSSGTALLLRHTN